MIPEIILKFCSGGNKINMSPENSLKLLCNQCVCEKIRPFQTDENINITILPPLIANKTSKQAQAVYSKSFLVTQIVNP